MSETIDLNALRESQRPEPPKVASPPPKRSKRTGLRAFVTAMKVLLPLLALILIGVAIVLPQIKPVDGEWTFGFSILSQNAETSSTVLQARYEGTDDKNRPFTITAASAEEREGVEDAIELSDLAADITMTDGTWVALTANSGTYQKGKRKLLIEGDVNLFQDQGYELRTDAALIDLSSGDVTSETAVTGQGPFGIIHSEGLEVRDEGQVIHFTGATELLLEPGGASGGLR